MVQQSFSDWLLSLVDPKASPVLDLIFPTLFYLLVHLLLVWVAYAGWRRHRTRGFLLLLTAWSSALFAHFINLYAFILHLLFIQSDLTRDSEKLYGLAQALRYLSVVFTAAGVWHLVYRTRILPAESERRDG